MCSRWPPGAPCRRGGGGGSGGGEAASAIGASSHRNQARAELDRLACLPSEAPARCSTTARVGGWKGRSLGSKQASLFTCTDAGLGTDEQQAAQEEVAEFKPAAAPPLRALGAPCAAGMCSVCCTSRHVQRVLHLTLCTVTWPAGWRHGRHGAWSLHPPAQRRGRCSPGAPGGWGRRSPLSACAAKCTPADPSSGTGVNQE